MNNETNDQISQSTLIAHCGTRKITREELREIPIPEATRTHQPLAHYQIVEVLEEALSFRYLKVKRDEYAVSQDGMKMFGVMDLNAEFSGCRFSIGLRNSNDKSMRFALTAGYRVFVCDNMAFSGDFNPLLHKHTKKLELYDAVSIAVDRIHRGFEPLKRQVQQMKDQVLTEDAVKLIIYRAFLDKAIRGIPKFLLPVIHDLYFNPQHEAFVPRNLWSLSNAFTSACKRLAPVKQFEITARIGAYLAQAQEELHNGSELDLRLNGNGQPAALPEAAAATAGKVLRMPQSPFLPEAADVDVYQSQPKAGYQDFGYEDFDEADTADDPYAGEDFDGYFDGEAASEAIDEAETEAAWLEEYERKAA